MSAVTLYVLCLFAMTTNVHIVWAAGGCEPKVETQCCKVTYASLDSDHSALLTNPTRSEEGVTAAEKSTIVNYHNQLRGTVENTGQPSAKDMLKMQWDDELATVAQKWASNCRFAHDANKARESPCRFAVGQNMAWSTAAKDWKTSAIDPWFNEHQYFTHGVGSNTAGKAVGHYTQVVWAKSVKIGCGYALCDPLDNSGSTSTAPKRLYVCNYGPAGNFGSTTAERNTPYVTGTKGADCPLSFNSVTGLCDCKGLSCNWGQILNPNTCKCNCKEDNLDQNTSGQCLLNCATASDGSVCGGGFTASMCAQFTNVKFTCPTMCGLCPCP